MSKLILFSNEGKGMSLAHRLQKEDNQVNVFIHDKDYSYVGLGLTTRIGSWRPSLFSSDLIIFDTAGHGHMKEQLEDFPIATFGVNRLADFASNDPQKQIEVLEKYGLQVPSYTNVYGVSEAIELPFPSSGCYIKSDDAVLCNNRYEYEYHLKDMAVDLPFIVQHKVTGISFTIEGWFDHKGNNWIEPFYYVLTEQSGNVIIPNRITKHNKTIGVVKKLGEFLTKIEYFGPVSISFVSTETGLYATKLYLGFKFNNYHGVLPLISCNFSDLLKGKTPKELGSRDVVSISSTVTIDEDIQRGYPIILSNKVHDCALTGVYKDDNMGDNVLSYCGYGKELLTITGIGSSIKGAKIDITKQLRCLASTKATFMKDIVPDAENIISKLKKRKHF